VPGNVAAGAAESPPVLAPALTAFELAPNHNATATMQNTAMQ
jgi:hypothetical protein